ncbi:MAG: hypothetical protein QXG03_02670 [Halalkalicoccus sp.]
MAVHVSLMGDDEPAYGSDEVENDDGQYGGTENGDEKRSAGGENESEEDDESEESEGDEGDGENEGESLGQDETDPE